MEVGLVKSIDIDHEMQQAYLDYAMSVIVARALPDARDGLKPVHRRILYAMYDMGLRPESAYKKSARIVGEVLGKYHPHGDAAVYEAMARMAQDFSMRYMLVDGQGNFGSVDGDPPAAMRYTEARLARPSNDILADIQKNTVDFSDNFDGTLQEPDVLPAAIPNLLVNGATGIAVGMSTSIPPHNLGEVVDGLNYMLEHWDDLDDINVEDLMKFIQGPDFPTGGLIIQPKEEEEGLHGAYGAGRGKVTVQARAHFEEMSRGRNRIIVTELPYMTNKASLIERIAELVRDGRLDGIADLRDESDRQGLRIVIELNKNAEPETVLRSLYKMTPMRSTFGIIMLALVDGEPRLLGLKQALRVYLEHRLVVIRRRSEFDLERARQRAHILEGLRVALKNLDEVIDLIRKAPDVETARARLMKRFKLSEVQTQAILDMPLRRLAALERKKIEDEYKEVQATIKDLESLLRSPKRMRQVVSEELNAVKEAYGDRRRTQIVRVDGDSDGKIPLLASDLTPDRTVWVTVSANGLVSRSHEDHMPHLSGQAAPRFAVRANTRQVLYLVNDQGEAAATPVHALPESEDLAAGSPLHKVSALPEGSKLAAAFSLPAKDRPEDSFVLTVTRMGQVKKSTAAELPGPSARSFTLMKVNEGDALQAVRLTGGKATILMATADGMAIRFSEEEVRPMGLVAAGVGGIKLQNRDEVIGVELLKDGQEALLLATDGKAKRVAADQFPVQGRYGQGVTAWKLPRSISLAGIAAGKPKDPAVILLERVAAKSIRLEEAPLQTRAAAGKLLVEPKAGILGLWSPADTSGSPLPEPAPKVKPARATNGKTDQASAAGKKGQAEKPSRAKKPSASGKSAGGKAASGKAAATKPAGGKAAAGKAAVKAASSKPAAKEKPASAKKTTAAKQPPAPKKKPAAADTAKPAPKKGTASKPAAKKPPTKKK